MINIQPNKHITNNNSNSTNQTTTKPKKKKVKNLRCSIERRHFNFLMEEIEKEKSEPTIKFNKKLLNAMCYFSGLRLNEVLLLNKKNFEELFDIGKLNVYCKKTDSHRWIYLKGNTRSLFFSYFRF